MRKNLGIAIPILQLAAFVGASALGACSSYAPGMEHTALSGASIPPGLFDAPAGAPGATTDYHAFPYDVQAGG